MTTTTEYNFDKICRSCLCESENLKSIFETRMNLSDTAKHETRVNSRRTRRSNLNGQKNEDQMTVNELIVVCAKVQISHNDGLPQTICDQCITDVQNAFIYKKKCEKSDLKLREYLKTKEIKKEETAKMVDIKHEDKDSSDNENDADYNPADDTEDGDNNSGGKCDPLFEYLTLNELKTDLCEVNMPKENDNMEGTDAKDNNNDHKVTANTDDSDDETLVKKAKLVDGRYICPICSRSLADRSTLTLHLRLHTGKKLKHCSLCNRGFSKQSHLNRHMNSHNKKVYTCDYCDQAFDTYQARRIHATTEHWSKKKSVPSSNLKRKNCSDTSVVIKDECEETSMVYNAWQRSKYKKCVCNICESSFGKISDLRKHFHWHADVNTTSADDDVLPKNTKLLNNLAAELRIESKDMTSEMLQLLIKSKLQNNLDMSMFYQIMNDLGWELSLSDSETENEDENNKITHEPHLCSKCRTSFNRLHEIMHHMKSNHSETISLDFADFQCKNCKFYFPNERILSKHVRSQCGNTRKKFICSICNYRFMWDDNLNEHTQKVHVTKANESEIGEIISVNKVSGENRVREKTFTCGICTKAFYRQEHLDRHKKIHSPAEKRFCCDICEKKFNRKDNLKSHMRIHRPDAEKDNVNKHLCVYCGKSFSNSSNLIVHMRRHTGEKPYKCDLCDKGFPRSSDLQCHRRTHTGEKPCLCTICGKGFSRSNKLVRHMRIHTGVRPYKCTYCDRAFTQSNDLTLHIRRHTGDKPYVCGICGDRFIQGTALAQHRRAQGHFEENNPQAPYSSISVNNPNRYTNANRVNRIGSIPSTTTTTANTDTKTQTLTKIVTSTTTDAAFLKPVMSLAISNNGIITTQPLENVVVTQANSSSDYTGNDIGPVETTTTSLIPPFIISQVPTTSNYLSATRLLPTPLVTQNVSSSSANTSTPSEITSLFSLSYNPGY